MGNCRSPKPNSGVQIPLPLPTIGILVSNMPSPISFTENENRLLQSTFTDIYQDDCVRSLEGPLIYSILKLLEQWPVTPTFTEQQSRRVQYQLEKYVELLKPYPYPYSPLTFGQDTQQLQIIQSALDKVKAGQV